MVVTCRVCVLLLKIMCVTKVLFSFEITSAVYADVSPTFIYDVQYFTKESPIITFKDN